MIRHLAPTLHFIAANPRLLAFGFIMPFASAFGQTFFIGVFGDALRESFALSNARFGLLYSLATLTSAGLLIWLGGVIDKVDLRAYTAGVGLTYAAACLVMALTPTWQVLVLAFLMLRLTGQGLMSHIGLTSMGRYFDTARGRASSIASLGHPAAEALFPPLAVAMIAWVGWRDTWLAIAAAVAFGVVPLALWLLRGQGTRERNRQAHLAERRRQDGDDGGGDWTVARVLRDPRFYLMLPAALLSPFTVTGLFFHQAALVAAKGWTLSWFAGAFVAFAAASVVGSIMTGGLSDRLSARKVLPGAVLPIAAGLVVLAVADAPWAAVLFMLGAGTTAGATLTLQGALWPEVYGTTHLGAVRSVIYAMMVVSTAVSPVLFGTLLDGGLSVAAISLGCVAFALLSSALALPVARGHLTPGRAAA
jgi:MFS family permease